MEESIGGGRLTVECHRDPNISKTSRSNPSLNGHLHDPEDIDRTLNEDVHDKVLQYRVDCNNRPSHTIAFMSSIASTSGCLHGEFVCLLFLLDHRETDRFLASSGVQVA